MNGWMTGVSTAAFAALIVCGPAGAHHSYAEFDVCAPKTIEGQIERISWTNPHIVMTVDTDDANKYMVVWLSLAQLARAGLTSDALKAGDRVVVTGARNRNPVLNVIARLNTVQRPSDGWEWTHTTNSPQCAD